MYHAWLWRCHAHNLVSLCIWNATPVFTTKHYHWQHKTNLSSASHMAQINACIQEVLCAQPVTIIKCHAMYHAPHNITKAIYTHCLSSFITNEAKGSLGGASNLRVTLTKKLAQFCRDDTSYLIKNIYPWLVNFITQELSSWGDEIYTARWYFLPG